MLSGAITEADFFHQKKHAYATSMQKRGFSTERQSATAQRVADVVTGEAKLAAKAGEKVTVHLSVTRMQAIFAEKPEVHRLFLAKVPHEMSEKAFWTAYLRKQEKKKLEQQAKAEAAALELGIAAAVGADAAAGAAGSSTTSSASRARRTTRPSGSGSGTPTRASTARRARPSSATRAASASSSTTTSRTTSGPPCGVGARRSGGRAI